MLPRKLNYKQTRFLDINYQHIFLSRPYRVRPCLFSAYATSTAITVLLLEFLV